MLCPDGNGAGKDQWDIENKCPENCEGRLSTPLLKQQIVHSDFLPATPLYEPAIHHGNASSTPNETTTASPKPYPVRFVRCPSGLVGGFKTGRRNRTMPIEVSEPLAAEIANAIPDPSTSTQDVPTWRWQLTQCAYKSKMLCAWLDRHLMIDKLHALKLAASVSSWYVSSISLTLFNKVIWTELPSARENTASLIALQSLCMSLVICLLYLTKQVDLSFATWKNVSIAFLPMAALASMDIAFTNSAYSFVSVSVVVVIKSAIPCLTYLCGVLFGLNAFSLKKILCLIWIAITVSLTVNEMKVDEAGYIGIVLSLLAVLASAVRWSLTHLFVKPTTSSSRCHSLKVVTDEVAPIQLVSIQQPLILLSLLPVVLSHDDAWHGLFRSTSETSGLPTHGRRLLGILHRPVQSPDIFNADTTALWLIIYAVVSSTLAFAVVASEVYIIKYTDSTTLTVGGIGKEILVLLCSAIMFSDVINTPTAFSIALTLAGIFCYAVIDRSEKNEMITAQSDDPELELDSETMIPPLILRDIEEHLSPRRSSVEKCANDWQMDEVAEVGGHQV